MTTALETAIEQLGTDIGLAHDIVHGDAETVVTTENGDVNSLAKTIADAQATAAAIIAPSTAAAVAAQTGTEAARDTTLGYKDDAEAAAGTAVAAAGVSVDAQTATEAARDTTLGYKDDAEAALTATETARDEAIAIIGGSVIALGADSEMDLAVSAWFQKTFAAGPVALTVTNWKPAGTISAFVLEAKNLGLATPTWPAGWYWAGDVEPIFSTDATDLISITSGDGGATVYAGVSLYGLKPGA